MVLPRKASARTKPASATSPEPKPARPWRAWRIVDGRFDPFSPVGAALVGGRWNSPGAGVIYASCSYAGALLEILAHAGIGRVPRNQVAVEITIAEAVSVERRDERNLPPGWDGTDLSQPRAFGDAWLHEHRSAVLVVPSVVARREGNVLINPQHPGFGFIVAGRPEPVVWDARLFGGGRAHDANLPLTI